MTRLIRRRDLLTGAAALAMHGALAQSITPQLGGGIGYGFDGALGGAGRVGPVLLDAVGTSNGLANNTTSINYTGLTVGAGQKRALVAVLSFNIGVLDQPPAGITCTWDGVPMTQISGTLISAVSGLPATIATVLFGLVAPNSGNKTLACSWTGNHYCYVDALSFTEVNQAGGSSSFGNGTAATGFSQFPQVSVSNPSGSFVVGVASSYISMTATNQTTLFIDNSDVRANGAANYGAGSGSPISLSVTQGASQIWTYSGASVNPG